MRHRQFNKVAGNIFSGTIAGLGIGIVYCVWIGLLYAFRGAGSFEIRGLRIEHLLLFYLVTGSICGAIVGGLRRWRSSILGARVVGVIAMLPVAFGAEILVQGNPGEWEAKHWILMICLGTVMGIVMGGSFQTASADDL